MKPDWILVANASEARLLQQEAQTPLALLQAFQHPASRLHSSELGDDQRGRERSDSRDGATAYEAHIEPQRKEHLRFARELAQVLEQGARHGRCGSIRIFACSPFLGELKAALGTATVAMLAGAEDVDLGAANVAEIGKRLQEMAACSGSHP